LIGDTRLEATLPTDGTYTVAVHDLEYATPGPGFFRMKVGQWSFADQVFPPVVGPNAKAVDLVGSAMPRRVDVPSLGKETFVVLPWPKEGVWSGSRPTVELSSRPELLEHAANGRPQDLPIGSVGVSGVLASAYEEDVYRVPVSANSRVRIEVFADRIRSPIDVALVVRNEMGVDLARAEDSPGSLDPVLEYAVPDKVTSLQVAVIDSQGRGSPKGIYRLVIDPVPATTTSDFRLFTSTQRIGSPVGGRSVIPIYAERKGYLGPITLAAEGLAGVKLDGAVIPAGADGTLVSVTQTASGPASISNWNGRSENGIERAVVLRGHPLERLQPWLANELAVANVARKPDEFAIDWRALAPEVGLKPGAKLTLPVKVTRPDPATPVRLTLLTSQSPPVLNNQPNPNAAIRMERPIELGAKVSAGDVPVQNPVEFPAATYDICVQAEILTPDKRTVLARIFTPVRTMPVQMPIAIKLESPSRIDTTLDPKTGVTVEISGRADRQNGYFGPVTLTLTGLPPGARADAVTVRPFATKFAIKVVLPPNTPIGELKGLKLTATVAPDAKQPNQRVRSRDVELTLNVQAGKK
jgi:hypothetical protein